MEGDHYYRSGGYAENPIVFDYGRSWLWSFTQLVEELEEVFLI